MSSMEKNKEMTPTEALENLLFSAQSKFFLSMDNNIDKILISRNFKYYEIIKNALEGKKQLKNKTQEFDSIEYEKLLKDTTLSKLVDKETEKIRIAFEKAQALDRALELFKQKRENAQRDLENKDVVSYIELITQIDTYTDCIATIEDEMGRTER